MNIGQNEKPQFPSKIFSTFKYLLSKQGEKSTNFLKYSFASDISTTEKRKKSRYLMKLIFKIYALKNKDLKGS